MDCLNPRRLILAACVFTALACGDGTAPGNIDDTPRKPSWSAVAVGTYDSCALTSDGQPYCWGFNNFIGCSVDSCTVDARPTRRGITQSFRSIAVGGEVHCAVDAAGAAFCWGRSFYGSLGDGVTESSALPIRVAIADPIRMVTVGFEHRCALTTAGVAYCWGDGSAAGVGPDAAGSISAPQPVSTTLRFTSISAGTTQTCAVAVDGAGYCWGHAYGTLGIGARDTACTYSSSCYHAYTPELVEGGLQWSSISAGNAFTCGVTLDHRGYCWGDVLLYDDPYPYRGVLGTGVLEGSKTPLPVAGGHEFQSISAGTRHACGLTTSGELYCWGENSSAELGIGRVGDSFPTPQAVAGGLRFASQSSGEVACAVSVNHNLYCWGVTYGGALGNGVSRGGYRSLPTRVSAPID